MPLSKWQYSQAMDLLNQITDYRNDLHRYRDGELPLSSLLKRADKIGELEIELRKFIQKNTEGLPLYAAEGSNATSPLPETKYSKRKRKNARANDKLSDTNNTVVA
jgi:hypothetical protein